MQASSGRADVADRTWPRSLRSYLELAVARSSARIARLWTADQLAAGGVADADTVHSAVLVVSELVTNAIQAVTQSAAAGQPTAGPVRLAGQILSFASPQPPRGPAGGLAPLSALAVPPRVCLVLTRFPALVRIEVQDSSRAPLRSGPLRAGEEESGRGLTVVAALAQTWGWEHRAAGKVVWCELAC